MSGGRSRDLTLGEVRRRSAARLRAISDTPELDADLLAGFALGLTRAQIFTREDRPLTSDEQARINHLVERRLAGEPVAYITGSKAFRNIELQVNEHVLVPRPETEAIVDIALQFLKSRGGSRRVVEVGTGSGAIALALATELGDRGGIELIAGDISQKALHIAAVNRERLGLEPRVRLVQSDLLAAISGRFDLILANLPYLRDDQQHPSTAREPREALYAGEDGLDAYRRLLPQVRERLAPDGLLVCEIDPSQADAMVAMARGLAGLPAAVRHDLAGRARFLLAGAVDFVRTLPDTN